MDVFDSRAIGPLDAYGQRFMRAGSYPYRLAPAGLTGLGTSTFLVEVTEAKEERRMEQHDVAVFAKGRELLADPPELTVAQGDMVLWHGRGLTTRFAVDGEKEFFRSNALVNESGFGHAFGVAGEFGWADANGSGLSGRVIVADFDASTDAGRRRWFETVGKGTVVMIEGRNAEPAEVKIIVGQTVFFAVVKAPGVSITDERLLGIVRPSPVERDLSSKKGKTYTGIRPRRRSRQRPNDQRLGAAEPRGTEDQREERR